MNAIAFCTKRAFHGFLRITRRAFASIDLTAARFDLMCVLYNRSPRRGAPVAAVLQSDVRKALGVTAGVVSRMLKGLDALGFTRRRRAPYDRRQVEVTLTSAGDETIRAARRMLLRGVQRMVLLAICFGRHRDPAAQLQNMDRLEGYLLALASNFGDRATLYYPWGHPDD